MARFAAAATAPHSFLESNFRTRVEYDAMLAMATDDERQSAEHACATKYATQQMEVRVLYLI